MTSLIDRRHFDIIIVGAGPAGLSTALTIRNLSDKTVCLVEKKTVGLIGEKVCGDGLNHNCFPFIKKIGLQQLPDKYFITKSLVLTIGNKIDTLPFKATIIDRLEFGQTMLQAARNNDIMIVPESTVSNVSITEQNVEVEITNLHRHADKMILTAECIVDASGISACIRKALSDNIPRFKMTRNHAVTFRQIITTPKKHNYFRCHMIYDPDIPTPGYFWIFPKSETILNVGITCPTDTKNLKNIFSTIFSRYCKVSDFSILHGKGDTYSTDMPLLNAVSNRFIAVGEAAGQVCPLFGEGHGPALKAGYFAGKVITSAVNYTQEELFEYNKLCLEEFNGDFVLKFVMAEHMKKIDFTEFAEIIPLLVNMAASHDNILVSIITKLPFIKTLLKNVAISRIKNDRTKNKVKQMMKLEKHLKKFPNNPTGFDKWVKELERIIS